MPPQSDYRHSYVTKVEEALFRFTVDQLKALVRLLPNANQPSRKAALIAEIERHLAGDLLRELWARLDETQQLAVREALHGATGEFSPQQFRAKYGRLPAGAGVRRYEGAKMSRLSLFLYATDEVGSSSAVIPDDLASRLHEFVAAAEAATLNVCDDLPATVARRRWRGSRETIAQVLLPWMHPDDLGPVGAFARGPADETTYLDPLSAVKKPESSSAVHYILIRNLDKHQNWLQNHYEKMSR